MTRLHTHCGRCSQCLDRRFGALAGGLGENDPAEMYEVDLLTGAREDSLDRTMASRSSATRWNCVACPQRAFMGRFAGELARAVTCFPGMSADKAAEAILDLHHRHAAAVQSVLEEGYRATRASSPSQTLATTCILRLVAGPGGIGSAGLTRAAPTSRDGRNRCAGLRRSSQTPHRARQPGTDACSSMAFRPLKGRGTFAVIQRAHRGLRRRTGAKGGLQRATPSSLPRTLCQTAG